MVVQPVVRLAPVAANAIRRSLRFNMCPPHLMRDEDARRRQFLQWVGSRHSTRPKLWLAPFRTSEREVLERLGNLQKKRGFRFADISKRLAFTALGFVKKLFFADLHAHKLLCQRR